MPERDAVLTSKAKFLDELCVLYGGRASEEIFFGKDMITTGASNDIERATKIARNMVMRYGMYEDIWRENFAWEYVSWNYTWADAERPVISEETQKRIDTRVREVLDAAYKLAIDTINKHKDLHIKISEDLLEKEEITREEFEEYFTGMKLA